MITAFKTFLRARPNLYDVMRRFDPRWPADRTFFNNFSRSRQGQVTFVQIGANDGLRNDPIREFVIGHEWSGIFVEPLPNVFELLKHNYRRVRDRKLVFVNAAISSADGSSLSFWTFQESFLRTLALENRLDYLQKSSFDKEKLLRFLGPRPDAEAILQEIEVPCLSMNRLIQDQWCDR